MGGKRACLCLIALVALALPAGASANVYVDEGPERITVGNELVERSFERSGFNTSALLDKRTGRDWASSPTPDFSLVLDGVELTSDQFSVTGVSTLDLDGGGKRVVLRLAPTLLDAGIEITRAIEAYPGIAGLRIETTLTTAAPTLLQRYQLESVGAGNSVTPAIQAFRAGADWREPGWAPQLTTGGTNTGDWREETTAAAGQPVAAYGEWISLSDGDDSAFVVLERNDLPSSRAAFDGTAGGVGVDFSRDILSLGPFEEQFHAENTFDVQTGRPRALLPGVPLQLEATFTGLASGAGDEGWQFHRYLVDERMPDWDRDVTFNSNGVDDNAISTGAKDDMNMANVERIAPIARRLGVETFILDDGWQAASGDWYPDSPDHPESRYDGNPSSKFAPRFPDSSFSAVREEIAPMKLGLWMNPTFFHPTSQTYKQHPEWICQPVGSGLTAYNFGDQTSGSNEAGLSGWGPDALPYVESRIRDMIENWGARYFKFDFLVWLDCLGQGDMYDFRDRFVAMVDRLQADYADDPGVTIEIDETNDYRLFPFESVARGPSWFLNGGPAPRTTLHTIWSLSPYVPAFTLGLGAFGNQDFNTHSVDTYMAAALLSHITFFNDVRRTPDAAIDRAGVWMDLYKRNRAAFTGVTYPLLDDPAEDGWTALQNWDPDAGVGSLLAFRQGDEAPSATVALENVPSGKTYELFEGPDETPAGTYSSAELRDGITVSAARNRAQVLVIREVAP